MFTFSGLVDHAVELTSRYDRRSLITTALNSTIRDLHIRPASAVNRMGAPVKYSENLVEVEFVPDSNVPVLWSIPKPSLFMDMSAVRCSVRMSVFQKRTPHSLIPLNKDFGTLGVYYRTGPHVAIVGAIPGVPMHIAYYTYLPSLAYIAPEARLITVTDDEFTLAGGGTPTAAQLALESNWMLARHWTALLEGTLSRVYRALNDLERSKIAYSAFNSMQAAIQTTESHE